MELDSVAEACGWLVPAGVGVAALSPEAFSFSFSPCELSVQSESWLVCDHSLSRPI